MVVSGRYSRGYLPHFEEQNAVQFLTWRLNDAVPASVVTAMRESLAHLPENDLKRELRIRVEAFSDGGHGQCVLRNSLNARVVQETLFANHGILYDLKGWVVMPNHVHVLLAPQPDVPLKRIVQSLKGSSAVQINRALGRTGRIWQPDYFDRYIRDSDHFYRTLKYIEWNPVKAKLCQDPALWPWSSANENARARLEFLYRSRTRSADFSPHESGGL